MAVKAPCIRPGQQGPADDLWQETRGEALRTQRRCFLGLKYAWEVRKLELEESMRTLVHGKARCLGDHRDEQLNVPWPRRPLQRQPYDVRALVPARTLQCVDAWHLLLGVDAALALLALRTPLCVDQDGSSEVEGNTSSVAGVRRPRSLLGWVESREVVAPEEVHTGWSKVAAFCHLGFEGEEASWFEIWHCRQKVSSCVIFDSEPYLLLLL